MNWDRIENESSRWSKPFREKRLQDLATIWNAPCLAFVHRARTWSWKQRSPNERDNKISGAMKDPSLSAWSTLETIGKATTKVRTSLLERNGIHGLRILSESLFIELLQDIREGLRQPAGEAARHAPALVVSPDERVSADPDRLHQEKWTELRAKHEASLSRIEGRMEKLSRAFQGIQGVFEKLEALSSAPPGSVVAPSGARPADEGKMKALLREMLDDRQPGQPAR